MCVGVVCVVCWFLYLVFGFCMCIWYCIVFVFCGFSVVVFVVGVVVVFVVVVYYYYYCCGGIFAVGASFGVHLCVCLYIEFVGVCCVMYVGTIRCLVFGI